jgi:hypothetical protein
MIDEEKRYTAFLIGSGVCVESWSPVQRAIREVVLELGADCGEISRDVANFILAQHVYEMRFAFADYRHLSPSKKRRLKARRPGYRGKDKLLKERIAQRLTEATDSGDLQLDERFKEAVVSALPVALFTANWDELLERSVTPGAPPPRVAHIHGSVREAKRLFLPTETTEETYRPRKDRQEFGEMIAALWGHIGAAQCIWFYGLSLDPSDAELGMVIRTGLSEPCSEPPRQLIISTKADEMARVRRRVEVIAKMSMREAEIIEDPIEGPLPKRNARGRFFRD